MFWLLDKQANIPGIFGSITAICDFTGLKAENLYYHFSRMKKKEFENNKYRIVKCSVQRFNR